MSIRVVRVNGLKTPEQRSGVCYVGRAFAGWPASPWGNPYRPGRKGEIADALEGFKCHAIIRNDGDPSWLADLWDGCKQGELPLGCWCVNATHGDGQAIVCHAQILASMLHERFVAPSRRLLPLEVQFDAPTIGPTGE